ncbi:hypothetical protein AB4Y42_06090 [Paraburkholderia sp. EG286B]|uniref:hypothetical protein n=1 Tax=Paraburkholderia sp. EG286B TaxID=3237011 RepID=UPI0034D2539B
MHTNHLRHAAEQRYKRALAAAESAPRIRAASDRISKLTRLSADDLPAALRAEAATLAADQGHPTTVKLLGDIAGMLEANHTDSNAWAALDNYRRDVSRAASRVEGIDPERERPNPAPVAVNGYGKTLPTKILYQGEPSAAATEEAAE